MEIFRDLSVSIELDQMAATADLIERTPPAGWVRDRAAEDQARAAPASDSEPRFCFSCSAEGRRAAATLILSPKGSGTFFVSIIIPLSKRQLEHGEYNTIHEDFAERVIGPYTRSEGTVALSNGWADLEDWMPREAAGLLRQFSECANRGIGSSHPSDRDRWNGFVLSAHRGGSRMAAAELRRWLTEVDGWPSEVADALAAEYQYGRELLAFADGRRRSA